MLKGMETMVKMYMTDKFHRQLRELEEQLQKLNDTSDDCVHAIRYDWVKVQSNDITELFEKRVIKKIDLENQIKSQIDNLKNLINKLENAYNDLPDRHKTVLKERYAHKEPVLYWQVADSMNYTERQCRRLVGSALAQLQADLNGVEVIWR